MPVSASPAPGSPAPPPLPPGALVMDPAVHSIGERASLPVGVQITSDGDRVAVAWAVPPTRPPGMVDVAGVLLDPSGERAAVIDPE
ncbi:MAG: hypothetical protein WCJ30_05770, partial [Deltaproteobacteria bacterium]